MSEINQPTTAKKTLGLTGLTVNAMAFPAPSFGRSLSSQTKKAKATKQKPKKI
jgi:hypothetical protein